MCFWMPLITAAISAKQKKNAADDASEAQSKQNMMVGDKRGPRPVAKPADDGKGDLINGALGMLGGAQAPAQSGGEQVDSLFGTSLDKEDDLSLLGGG